MTFPTPHHGPTPHKRAQINRIHEHCTSLVDALAPHLPEPDRQRVRTGLDVSERLYLLEDLCAALHQDRIPITPDEHTLLVAALDLLGAGDDTTPTLRDRDTVLPALVVAA